MAKMVTLTIDGHAVSVPEGTLIVNAAKTIGIDIPVFCYHPKMEPVGMCRQCLVEVGRPVIDRATGQPVLENGMPKIAFGPKLETACTTPVSEGMLVLSQSEKARTAQKEILEFLLTSHPLDCPVCDKGGECPLQNLTLAYGPSESRFIFRRETSRRETRPPGRQDLPGPRALHPVRPLHPLPGQGCRRACAGFLPARPRYRYHHQFRAAFRLDLLRQHHRHLPGRRADHGGLPLWRPPLGDEGGGIHLPALPGGLQYHLQHPP